MMVQWRILLVSTKVEQSTATDKAQASRKSGSNGSKW